MCYLERKISALLLVLSGVFLMTSCSDDDDSPNSGNSGNEVGKELVASLNFKIYEYDVDTERPVVVQDTKVSFDYDAKGQIAKMKIFEDNEMWPFAYEYKKDMVLCKYEGEVYNRYLLDAENRIWQTSSADGDAFNISYNDKGELQQIRDEAASMKFMWENGKVARYESWFTCSEFVYNPLLVNNSNINLNVLLIPDFTDGIGHEEISLLFGSGSSGYFLGKPMGGENDAMIDSYVMFDGAKGRVSFKYEYDKHKRITEIKGYTQELPYDEFGETLWAEISIQYK